MANEKTLTVKEVAHRLKLTPAYVRRVLRANPISKHSAHSQYEFTSSQFDKIAKRIEAGRNNAGKKAKPAKKTKKARKAKKGPELVESAA